MNRLYKPIWNARSGFCFLLLASSLLFPVFSNATPVRGVPGDLWADLVLGQTDGPVSGTGVTVLNSAFGQWSPNQITNNRVYHPAGVFVDRSGAGRAQPDRLYIWDAGNSRILGFSDIQKAVLQSNGVSCLGSDPTAVPQGADIVIGQPDFSHGGCNGDSNNQSYTVGMPAGAYGGVTPPNQYELCGGPPWIKSPIEAGYSYSNMASDSQGNLYVADIYNNRVLRYEIGNLNSGSVDAPASYVWGHSNFTNFQTNDGNGIPNSSSLAFNLNASGTFGGVAVDSLGNLWVADAQNNRVLRFPFNSSLVPPRPDSSADIVLGQNSINTNGTGTGLNQMCGPTGVRVDSNGNVFVSEFQAACGARGRVLVFAPTGILGGVPQYQATGQTAIGQVTNGVSGPLGMDLDIQGNLWIVNDDGGGGMNQAVMYQISIVGNSLTATPQKEILRSTFTSTNSPATGPGDGPNFQYAYPSGMTGQSWYMDSGTGIGVDRNGNVFISATGPFEDVWRFPAPIPDQPTASARSADIDVFMPSQITMFNQAGIANIREGLGVAVAQVAPTPQVIVSDGSRLLFWNSDGPSNLHNGKPADGIAGTNAAAEFNFDSNHLFSRIRVDQANPQHLWTDSFNQQSIEVYNLPLTNLEPAAVTINGPISVLGLGTTNWINSGVWGLTDILPAQDGSVSFLWIVDQINSRVMRIRNPLGAPVIDVIIGQVGIGPGDNQCNRGGSPASNTLCNPGAVALDHHGNLYISDASLEFAGNWRLLEYDVSVVNAAVTQAVLAATCGVTATHVYDRNGNFGVGNQSCFPVNICEPFLPAFASADQAMVVGSMNASPLPVVVPHPIGNYDNGSVPSSPWTNLQDYSSVLYSTTFDKQDNLYTTDKDRARVLIYLQPFPADTTTPTPSNTPTNTPILMPTLTATNSPTNTPTWTPTLSLTSTSTASPTASPTLTPTFTLTNTLTSSSTPTPTASFTTTPTSSTPGTPVIYPNPVTIGGTVTLHLFLAGPSDVKVQIFTLTSRKVQEEVFPQVPVGTDLTLSLVDKWGTPLANGLFYVVVNTNRVRWVGKLLILL